jgi:hypothetical protein
LARLSINARSQRSGSKGLVLQNRFGNRKTAAGFENAMEFIESSPFIRNIGYRCASDDCIDSRIADPQKLLGRAFEKRTLTLNLPADGTGLRMTQ